MASAPRQNSPPARSASEDGSGIGDVAVADPDVNELIPSDKGQVDGTGVMKLAHCTNDEAPSSGVLMPIGIPVNREDPLNGLNGVAKYKLIESAEMVGPSNRNST